MKYLFSKIERAKGEIIFNLFGVSVYFGKFNIENRHGVKHLHSRIYYPIFIVFLFLRNMMSRVYIFKSTTPILGENGYIDNKTLFFNNGEVTKLNLEILAPILILVSKRNFYLLDNFDNTAFLEIKPRNIKKLDNYRALIDSYSHIYIKVLGINKNNLEKVSEFIAGKDNLTLVDKYVPSINLVSKVSMVVTDDKLSSVTYKIINDNVNLISEHNRGGMLVPQSALSAYDKQFISYENYLIDNLLYTFLLTVPDQLIEENRNYNDLLELANRLENTSETSRLLLSMISFIANPTDENEENFIKLYTNYLSSGELVRKFYYISEALIVNCKLDTLSKIISILVMKYVNSSLYGNHRNESFNEVFSSVQIITKKANGRIVDYKFLQKPNVILQLIRLSNGTIKNISLLVRVFVENRNELLIKLVFEHLELYNKSDLHKLHAAIKVHISNLGPLCEVYSQYWDVYLTRSGEQVGSDLKINPYIDIKNSVESDNAVECQKVNCLESSYSEIINHQELTNNQKFEVLLQRGNSNEALLINGLRGKKSFRLYSNNKDQAEIVRHVMTSNKILIKTESNKSKKDTIIIDISLQCMNSKTQFFALFPWINNQGIQFLSLLSSSLIKTRDIDSDLEQINKEFNIDWLLQTTDYMDLFNVDIENKNITYQGVNYFHGFYEAAACKARTYDIDHTLEVNKNQYEIRIRSASILISYLDKVYQYACESKKRIIFVGGNSHLAPYSCIRDYILSKKSKNLNFVAIGAAYENYYSNFSTNYSKCFGIVNQSFNPNIRAAFLPEKARFESWLSENLENEEIIGKVNSLIKVNRNFSDAPVCNDLLNKINNERVKRKKVICCFGKIVFDSAVPYDGGPAHDGFKDWLNHTIEVAKSSPELLVLIKPHPHELKVEIAMKIGQYLRDLLPESLPDNVIFLDHESFNTYEIAQIVDLAVLWNGTSSMELTSLGVPVMMCGHFGLYDYHLDLIYPKDRNDYVLKLRDTQKIIIDEKLKYRAMAYVSYMGHHETAIPNQYARRQLLNDPVGIPIWYEDKLVNLINLNDENMKYALDKILYNCVPC